MATIRDYDVTVHNITADIVVNDKSKTSYAALPTLAEIRRVTGGDVEVINLEYCFADCSSLTTPPTIPSGVTSMSSCFDGCTALTTAPTIPNSVINMSSCFYSCTALTTPPTIPNSVTDMRSCFNGCTALTTPPTIPNSVTSLASCFRNCKSLTTAPAIPSNVTSMANCFNNCISLVTAPTIPNSVTDMSFCFTYCTSLTGKIIINANPSSYMDCMWETQQEIVLVGSSAQLQNIADTATNSNVYVWSLSINLSAERQEDDSSKVNVSVIINRFRNNNESVSLTFTIDSVESAPVQVTMDTATKTYTGVLSIAPFSIVELSVIAEDSYGKSAPKSITIPIPFYTIDFQAGGKEIAVGAPANDDVSNHPNGLFKCVMDAQFGRNAEFYGNLTLGGHDSPIGTKLESSKTNISITAGIDNHHDGASLTLGKGVWIAIGRWSFNTRANGTTSSNRQTSIEVNGTTWMSQRINTYGGNFGMLQCVAILNLTNESNTVVCAGSCSQATSGKNYDTSLLIAVRIA